MTGKLTKIDMAAGSVLVLLFILLSFSRPLFFEKIGIQVYDLGMKCTRPDWPVADNNIILIDIDDKSLAALGPWPWPRRLIGEMIGILKDNGAKLIGLNIPFTEKERNAGLQEVMAFREEYDTYSKAKQDTALREWILENLDKIEKRLDDDAKLVESVKNGNNVILPVSIDHDQNQEGTTNSDELPLSDNFLASSNVSQSLRESISVNRLSPPFPELAQNSAGLGHGDTASGYPMAGRSHPAYIDYKDSLLPSFPLRLVIANFKQKPSQIPAGDNQVIINGRSIPLTRGEMLVRFEGGVNGFPHFSFADILSNRRAQPGLKDKIILIGLNNSESVRFDTPYSTNMPESELIANILEDMINFRFITRPRTMSYIEISILFLLGMFASFYFSRKGPFTVLAGTAGLIALNIAAGIILLSQMGLWYRPVYISGCLASIFLYILFRDMFMTGRFLDESKGDSPSPGIDLRGRGRMKRKDLAAYRDINKGSGSRDLGEHMPRLKKSVGFPAPGPDDSLEDTRETNAILSSPEVIRTSVGRYRILNELGRGSIGLVYKARDPKLNRDVAIKTIRLSDEFDEDLIGEIKESFLIEAEKAARLHHPSIVTIYEVGEDQDLIYITMEFLEGEGLNKFINRGGLLRFRKTLNVTANIASALDFAHREGVIHRGIKPGNVILLKDGRIKVTDFALARAFSSFRTRTGVILGTPDYMSPEQIMGQKIDSRSDIFSLGVLFYQLLTGELPFRGKNLKTLLYQITQVTHPSPRRYNNKIPKVCEQIIDRALAKDQAGRFQSAGEMAKIIILLGKKMDQIRSKKSGI